MAETPKARANGSGTELAVAEKQSMRAPIAAGNRGLVLTSLDEYWRFSEFVARSGLAPKGMERPETIMVAIQFGAEVGLAPLQSVQSIAVINGRPSMWGDMLLALARSSELWDDSAFREWFTGTFPNDDFTAHITCKRRGSQHIVESSFSVADAKLAKLWGKTGRDGQPTPWIQYPKRMLQMRARSFGLRDGFTDVLRGMIAREEAEDIPTVKAEVVGSRPAVGAAGLMDRLESASPFGEQPSPPEPAEPENDSCDGAKADALLAVRHARPGDCIEFVKCDVVSVRDGAGRAYTLTVGDGEVSLPIAMNTPAGQERPEFRPGDTVMLRNVAVTGTMEKPVYAAESAETL